MLRHQGPVAHEEKVARRVLRGRRRPEERLRLAAVEGTHQDLVPFGGKRAREAREKEKVLSVRKEERQPVRIVAALRVELRKRLRLAAVLRDDVKGAARRGREDDDARRTPGPALRKVGGRAEDRRWPARGLDPLELLVGPESDEAAVGRPERVLGILCSRERLRLGRIQGPHVEPHPPVGTAGRERELAAVGREGGRSRLRRVDDEGRSLRRVDRRAVDALLGRAGAERERPRRGRERGRNRPGEIERGISAPSLDSSAALRPTVGWQRGLFFEG